MSKDFLNLSVFVFLNPHPLPWFSQSVRTLLDPMGLFVVVVCVFSARSVPVASLTLAPGLYSC